jgi:hypothetical protein
MAYIENIDNINMNDNINHINIYDNINNIYDETDITWDDPATPVAQPIAPVIAPNGWHWYPDANGNLCSHYVDQDGNDSTVWMQNNDGSFYWQCAGVGYTCRDIGIEGRRGIFFQDLIVGTMIMDNQLTVTWLPETYINHEQIQINTEINNIYDETETDDEDFTDDENDP